MLNGVAPIFIFTFFKNALPTIKDGKASIPIVSVDVTQFSLPPIPLYLDENLTGVFIDTETKAVDAETVVDTLTSGGTPQVTQKAINSTVTVNMVAKKDSIGLNILSSMIDIIYQLLTSKEYQITYLNGSTTIFLGLLHSYNVSQSAEDDLLKIAITISKSTNNTLPKTPIPVLANTTGTLPIK